MLESIQGQAKRAPDFADGCVMLGRSFAVTRPGIFLRLPMMSPGSVTVGLQERFHGHSQN